jgi:hypothetical protein
MEQTVLDIVLEAFPVLAMVLVIVMLPLLSDRPPGQPDKPPGPHPSPNPRRSRPTGPSLTGRHPL